MLNKRCLSLLLCAVFAVFALMPATTAKAADGELTVNHSTSGNLAAEITAAAGGNASSYTKLNIIINSVDLSGDYSSGDWNTLVGLNTLLPSAASLELVYKSGTHIIADYAMYTGSWLKTLIFTNDGGQLTDIGKFAFYECTGFSGTLAIPSTVTTIGTCAFYGCYRLTALSLPSMGSLTIGNSAFADCTGLSTLTIPSSVTAIGESAFENCTGLSGTLTISSSMTSIGSNAFQGCTGLTSLSLPDGSFTISSGAFEGCTGLSTLTIPSSVTAIDESAFDGCSGLSGTLTIPSSVTSIGSCAFRSCTGLTSLSLPATGSLSIVDGAFQGCTGLSGTVVIPSSVTSLGVYSFDYCTSLTALVFKKADSAPTMSSPILRETQITAYYPKSAESSYTAQSGFPANRAAYDDSSAIITSLNINGVRGTIDQTAKTVIVDLPTGTNRSALKPDIGFIGKSMSPVSGDAQDFSSWKRTCTITPVSGTPATYSVYIMGDPTVSGSNTISGTVGDVGDQTVTATVSAAGWPEKMTLKASIGGNEDIANRVGNGRATFYFSGSLFDDFAVGSYPITVSADATTYNHAITSTQIGTLTVKPIAPVIKSATVNGASVTITWDAVSGADGYKVYSYDPNTKAYTEIAATAGTSHIQGDLAPGTTYYYAVCSYQTVSGSPICSNYSATASAETPAPPAPPAPPVTPVAPTEPTEPIPPAEPTAQSASISATAASYNKIYVSWAAVPGAKGYQLYRAESPAGKYKLIKTLSKTSYVNSGLKTGTAYYYKIKSYVKIGSKKVYDSYFSPASCATPVLGTVTGPNAKANNPAAVKITWKAVAGASKYEVWRSTSPDSGFALVKAVSGRSYKDSNLTPNTTYYYRVRAYRMVGRVKVYGEYSAVVSAKPVLAQVTGAKAARANASGIKLSWKSVTGKTKYEIWTSDKSDGTYTLLAEMRARYYYHGNIAAGTAYYYKIRAYRLVGGVKAYGDYSSVVSAKP